MRTAGGLAALLVLALAVPAAAVAPSPADALFGKAVVSLSFRGDGAIDEKRMAGLTEIGPGRLLTEGAVRLSLRNLFATQRFSDLAVEAAPSGDGVAVVILFSAAPRIVSFAVTKGIPARGRVLDALGLGPGDPWESDRLPTFEASIRRVLKDVGYFQPVVTASVDAADETGVDVRFDVRPGPRAVAAAPQWDGSLVPLSAADFLANARQKVGRTYRKATARDDAERFEAALHKRGYSRAEVRLVDERYDAAKAAVSPRYSVFVGPLVVLRVLGEKESVVRTHEDSPWRKGEPPDEDAVERLRLGLKRSYAEEGYAKAAVHVDFDTQPGREIVTFAIDKGARWSIERVNVPGAVSLPPKNVASALETRPRGILQTGRYVSDEAARDRDALASLYLRDGWRDVSVAPPAVADGTVEHALDVTFAVDEGVRTVVDRMKVEGIHLLSERDLVPHLTVKAGAPYSESAVSADAALLQSLYVDRGFVDAKVEATTRFSGPEPPESERADVTYLVTEGKPVVFGKTIVRGNRRTKPFIIEDRLATAEGTPFSLTKLLDTQQRLARLGVFERIDVTTLETDPGTMSKSVLVTVAESRPWSLTYAVGAEYNPQQNASLSQQLSLRLSLAVTYSNLFGRALEVGVEGRASNTDPRLIFTARDQSLFGGKVPVSFAVYQTTDVPSTAYNVKRSGTFLQGEYRLSKTLRTALRVQYELVNPSADPGLGADQLGNQESRIASVSGGITWDERDDPLNPRSGFLLRTDVKYAFPLLAADAHFFKVLSQAGLYRPWGKTRFAFSFRAGFIWNLAPCPDALIQAGTCAPNLIIPVPERFFAGGSSTQRAFTLDNLGIPGQTLNADGVGEGGNFMLIGNAEWRVPVAGSFEVGFFVDAGNTWVDPTNVNLGQIRTGAGIGLHYLTPVGPLRLEYGLKLDRKPGEDAGAFAFAVGYGF